jgi:hypothetical protein
MSSNGPDQQKLFNQTKDTLLESLAHHLLVKQIPLPDSIDENGIMVMAWMHSPAVRMQSGSNQNKLTEFEENWKLEIEEKPSAHQEALLAVRRMGTMASPTTLDELRQGHANVSEESSEESGEESGYESDSEPNPEVSPRIKAYKSDRRKYY